MLAATNNVAVGDSFMRKKTDKVRRPRIAQTPQSTWQPIGRGATLNSLAVAIAGILYCASGAYAADEQTAAPVATSAVNTGSNSVEEVVVTASAQGVRKLDAR